MPRKKAVTEETVIETAEKKETAAKKPAAKKAAKKTEEAPKAESTKKPAAKKTAVKKTAEPEASATVTIQFKGKDIAAKDVLEAAKNAYREANPDGAIKSIDLYVKPEENVAYYAVNGEGSEDFKISL